LRPWQAAKNPVSLPPHFRALAIRAGDGGDMSEIEARLEALRLANALAGQETAEETVKRAETYFAFLAPSRGPPKLRAA
jgi:hypothetical protein